MQLVDSTSLHASPTYIRLALLGTNVSPREDLQAVKVLYKICRLQMAAKDRPSSAIGSTVYVQEACVSYMLSTEFTAQAMAGRHSMVAPAG